MKDYDMGDFRIVYNGDNGTWDVIVDGWCYFKGNREQAERVFEVFTRND